jgi:membrane protease YdiL (CAAX protease family)
VDSILSRVVTRPPSLLRALAYAAGIAAVVLGAQLALALLPLSRADALALDVSASAATLALLAFAVAALLPTPPAVRLGLARGRLDARRIALATLGVVALSHAAEAALDLAGVVSPGLLRFDDALSGLDPAAALFPLLAITLGSACGEEIFFRGLLQRGLAPRLGAPAAVALASLAFGAAHGDWVHGAAAALLGAVLGLVAHAADSIRPAIAAHAVNNAAALLEKILDLQLPSGPVATPTLLAGALTLACVACAAAVRAPAPRLQPAPRPSE